MELGLLRKVDIDREMQQAYLDYAMSVIVARALPDARDGLKPVQRRILYAMYDMGLHPNAAFKKSARIVGEVLGKYHPHGDAAVYEAMARLAQDFTMRYLLIEGQGNFGSVDGDPPAAMRYTEARLTGLAMEMLRDIEKNTVDFVPNFDDTLTEPAVLPAAIPNLLVNGSSGIAVGMATSIPPHNLGEVIDALVFMLESWEKLEEITTEQLMRFIQGPDFPTGGLVIDQAGDGSLQSAYGSGRGRILVQARAHIEEMERGRSRILITEIPYQVNKASLIENIASLAREGQIEGISDLRDESDRHGMRIVIELSKNADAEKTLEALFRHTPMRTTFSLILLALVDGEPRLLTLKQALRVYLEHRLTVTRRRATFDLEKARQRAHILEGLRIALQNLDEIITLIRNAPDAETARTRLIRRFKLSELQANAILEMQLRRLAALERKKIETEYKETLAQIKELETLLKSSKKMRQAVAAELQQVKARYADRRRTQIVRWGEEQKRVSGVMAQALPAQKAWVGIGREGQIGRTADERMPSLSGSGAPRLLLKVSTNDTLYLVAQDGRAAAIPVQVLPQVEAWKQGILWYKVSPLRETQSVQAIFALSLQRKEMPSDLYVMSVTRQGMVKRTAVEELPGPSAQAFTLARIQEGDALLRVLWTREEDEVLLITAKGMAIRFAVREVRPMGLVAAGVSGIKLESGDEVIGAHILRPGTTLLLLTSEGRAKRLSIEEFPRQGRYGKGVIAWELPKGARLVDSVLGEKGTSLGILLRKGSAHALRLDEVPLRKRSAVRGDVVVEVGKDDAVIGVVGE
jgi:DNA gyrase subunit A